MKIPVSRLPGTPSLIADYFDDFSKVAEFYNGDYRQNNVFIARSELVKSRELTLGKLVPVLKEQNQRFGCGSQTLEKIDLLLERNACAVVTGQQTGLFGGPLFTIYKALTAIKLAKRLNRNCEGCYVAIFWLASEDHDIREVDHIHFLDKQNQLREMRYGEHSAGSRIPVNQIEIEKEIETLIHELDEATHPSEFKQQILEQLRQAYHPAASFSNAFGSWLMSLLKRYGIIFIDAADARLKRLAIPLFQKEIEEHSPSTEATLAASERLQQKDYHTQVQLQEGFLNLFYAEKGRSSIELRGQNYFIKQEEKTFSKEELLGRLETNPEFFSPNVLLRPLYQDALLPTVAYVAGPAETAYYAQMKGIYERFDIPMPIIYPRKSVTLLEGKIGKVLDNYDLTVPDFWGDVEQLVTAIAKSQLPDALEKRIGNATACVTKNLQVLAETVSEFEPTLTDTVQKMQNKILGQVDGLEKKITQAYKKRNEIIGQQIRKAGTNLYPNSNLQERELNITPYLFKHGFDFIDQIYDAIDISSFDHQIVEI